MTHIMYTGIHTYCSIMQGRESKHGNLTARLSFSILVSLGCHDKYLKIDSFCTYFP